MSVYGDVLFGGSRFVKWALSPFLLLTLVALPFCNSEWTLQSTLMISALELPGLLILIGLWTQKSTSIVLFRIVTFIIFLFCLWYFIDQTFLTGKPFIISTRRSDSNPWNSLMALIFIGGPCFMFSALGRFTLTPYQEFDSELEEEEELGEEEREK